MQLLFQTSANIFRDSIQMLTYLLLYGLRRKLMLKQTAQNWMFCHVMTAMLEIPTWVITVLEILGHITIGIGIEASIQLVWKAAKKLKFLIHILIFHFNSYFLVPYLPQLRTPVHFFAVLATNLPFWFISRKYKSSKSEHVTFKVYSSVNTLQDIKIPYFKVIGTEWTVCMQQSTFYPNTPD